MVGKTLGHYEILEPLGAGGMGEVYRARDTQLDRDVAIKVLPPSLADSPDRLARFDREAKLLASLNHSNIGSIYGLEETDGVHFLVLELIEGESLERRLQRGPIQVPEALDIARQIAEALEAAHDAGIIHRDVKPANVLLTGKGGVKVLDFGVAKSTALDGQTNAALTEQATSLTMDGTLMGTPPYMAPEQVRGEEADKRADIWAFGCVVYEMLAGKAAFARETVADTLVAVLEQEPDWGALSRTTPATVRGVLRRCLRKDPSRRLHHIADARIEIEQGPEAPIESVAAPRDAAAAYGWRSVVPWGIAAGLLIVTAVAVYQASRDAAPAPMHLVALPPDSGFPWGNVSSNVPPRFALSPDGSRLVYEGRRTPTSDVELFVKSMDSLYGTPLSERGGTPFFAPNGQTVGYTTGGEFRAVPVTGGAPLPLFRFEESPRGASLAPDGTLVIGSLFGPLLRVPAGETEADQLTTLDAGRGETTHRWPQVFPDGSAVLFNIYTDGSWDDAEIAVLATGSDEWKILPGLRGTYPRYVSTGHILFARAGALFAAPFDTGALEVIGPAASVLEGIQVNSGGMGAAHYAISEDAETLVYVHRVAPEYELVLTDRHGSAIEVLDVPPGITPRFSPNGRYLSSEGTGPNRNLYLFDIERGSTTAISSGDTDDVGAQWMPTSDALVFSSNPTGRYELFLLPIDGSGPAQDLLPSVPSSNTYSSSVHRDGRSVLYHALDDVTAWDTHWLTRGDDGSASVELLGGRGNQSSAVFHPSGDLIALAESGDPRSIVVRPWPEPLTRRWVVSTGPAHAPIWSRDGRELFFIQQGRLMVVPIELQPGFSAGTPRELFPLAGEFFVGRTFNPAPFDVSPDGEHFVLRRIARAEMVSINLIVNFSDTLERAAPAGR